MRDLRLDPVTIVARPVEGAINIAARIAAEVQG
jgi:hypothetical protein